MMIKIMNLANWAELPEQVGTLKHIADSLIERNHSKIEPYYEFIISSLLSTLMKKKGG